MCCRPLAPSAIVPAHPFASDSAARPPMPTSTSRSNASPRSFARSGRTASKFSQTNCERPPAGSGELETMNSNARITIAHSPDSDDAFMFYGLASGNVDTGGIVVEQVLSDIETLNRAAFEGKYEVTAVSFHAFAHLLDRYALLPHGASMGDRYGPIVVTRADGPNGVKGRRIAIPGTLTTAYLALRLYEPDFDFVVVPFDQIQQAVLDGQAEAGLLIHEGQLTYQDEGLRKVVDLGEWWAERTGGLPLPLGGNVIRRDLGAATIATLSRLLHDSIAFGLA